MTVKPDISRRKQRNTCIHDRIADAVRRSALNGYVGCKVIYMTEEDHIELKRALGARLWSEVQEYRGTPIRRGRRSLIVSNHGCATGIHKVLFNP